MNKSQPTRPDPVGYDRSDEVFNSILAHFNDPKYPDVEITSLVETVTVANLDTQPGVCHYTTSIRFIADAQNEWFISMGMLCVQLGIPVEGGFPRRVSLNISHQVADKKTVAMVIGGKEVHCPNIDAQPSTLHIALIVHVFVVEKEND